jgi:hypothetical protein
MALSLLGVHPSSLQCGNGAAGCRCGAAEPSALLAVSSSDGTVRRPPKPRLHEGSDFAALFALQTVGTALAGNPQLTHATVISQVRLLALGLLSGVWRPLALLQRLEHPVLSFAHAPLPAARDGSVCLVAGDTAGGLAVWALDTGLALVCSCAADGLARRGPRAEPRPLRPLLRVSGLHRCGVNALALTALPTPAAGGQAGPAVRLAVLSGGDDQALGALTLSLEPQRSAAPPRDAAGDCSAEAPAAWSAALLGASLRPLAHASALRGVATVADPEPERRAQEEAHVAVGGGHVGAAPAGPVAHVCSVGLDQVLRVWALREPAAAAGDEAGCIGGSSWWASPCPTRTASWWAHQEAARVGGESGGLSVCLQLASDVQGRCRLELRACARDTEAGAGPAQGLQVEALHEPHVGSRERAAEVLRTAAAAAALDCVVGGEWPVVAEPVAAAAVEVPEPACVAAVGVVAGTAGCGRLAGDGRMGALRGAVAVGGRGLQLVEMRRALY